MPSVTSLTSYFNTASFGDQNALTRNQESLALTLDSAAHELGNWKTLISMSAGGVAFEGGQLAATALFGSCAPLVALPFISKAFSFALGAVSDTGITTAVNHALGNGGGDESFLERLNTQGLARAVGLMAVGQSFAVMQVMQGVAGATREAMCEASSQTKPGAVLHQIVMGLQCHLGSTMSGVFGGNMVQGVEQRLRIKTQNMRVEVGNLLSASRRDWGNRALQALGMKENWVPAGGVLDPTHTVFSETEEPRGTSGSKLTLVKTGESEKRVKPPSKLTPLLKTLLPKNGASLGAALLTAGALSMAYVGALPSATGLLIGAGILYSKRNTLEPSQDSTKPFMTLKHLVPNGITALAYVAALASIDFTMSGAFGAAALCLPFAAVFDLFDGKAARVLHAEHPAGALYDSQADLSAYAVATGIFAKALLTSWGMPEKGYIVGLTIAFSGHLRLGIFGVLKEFGIWEPSHDIFGNRISRERSDFVGMATTVMGLVVPLLYAICGTENPQLTTFLHRISGNITSHDLFYWGAFTFGSAMMWPARFIKMGGMLFRSDKDNPLRRAMAVGDAVVLSGSGVSTLASGNPYYLAYGAMFVLGSYITLPFTERAIREVYDRRLIAREKRLTMRVIDDLVEEIKNAPDPIEQPPTDPSS